MAASVPRGRATVTPTCRCGTIRVPGPGSAPAGPSAPARYSRVRVAASGCRMPSTYDRFHLVSDFELRGDQPQAIAEIVAGLERGDPAQVLLGVTGSGKTFTMAQCIAQREPPDAGHGAQQDAGGAALPGVPAVLSRTTPSSTSSRTTTTTSPRRTCPATDSYIEKEATINDEIDRMRLSATRSLFERRDVIIVASVSCIYGLGSPEAYYGMMLPLERGQRIRREDILAQARRDPVRAQRSRVRARHVPRPGRHHRGLPVATRRTPSGSSCSATRSTSWSRSTPSRGRARRRHDRLAVYPKSHFVTPRENLKRAVETHQGGAGGAARRNSSSRASCSRRSGSTSGRCSTWR